MSWQDVAGWYLYDDDDVLLVLVLVWFHFDGVNVTNGNTLSRCCVHAYTFNNLKQKDSLLSWWSIDTDRTVLYSPWWHYFLARATVTTLGPILLHSPQQVDCVKIVERETKKKLRKKNNCSSVQCNQERNFRGRNDWYRISYHDDDHRLAQVF